MSSYRGVRCTLRRLWIVLVSVEKSVDIGYSHVLGIPKGARRVGTGDHSIMQSYAEF